MIKNLTLEERASKYDMTIDAIKDIEEAFNMYAKKEKMSPSSKA